MDAELSRHFARYEIADDDSQRFIVMDFLAGITLRERIGGHETWRNKKNRDIGYALAANSCEGVGNVDTCTVAVPDAITAFAVPNPGVSSQSRRFFRVWPSSESPHPTYHPAYFGLATIMKPILSAIDATKVSVSSEVVNARSLCNQRVGDGPVNAPNGLSVKAFADKEGNSPQKRFYWPVEIFLKMDTKNHGNLLTGYTVFTHGAVRKLRNDMCHLVAYVDGSSHGSPGPSGIGVIVEDSGGGRIRIAKWIGWQDNNVAEYVALLEALQCALARRARSLRVYSDSEVVVRQMCGEYACRSPRLYSLNWICRKLARSLEFAITRIPRERNLEANHLANSVALLCRDLTDG